jgi:hypothetical protein
MTSQRGYDVETLAAAKIYSNVKCENISADYGVTTDSGHVELSLEDGKKVEVVPSTYYEHVGQNCNQEEPAKIIFAKNGNIHLEAQNGDIVLKARNIRIVAEDGSGEITLNSGKIIKIKAPSTNIAGTNVTTTAPGNLETIAGTVSSGAQIQNQSGSATDLLQGSFLGSIMKVLSSVEKFFKEYLT